VHTTNFLPRIDIEPCTGCGRCVQVCPVEAMSLVSANDPHRPKREKAKLDTDTCLGCGLCVRACTVGALRLEPRPQRVITPLNSAHRVVLMAIERGKLQNLIFENRALASHRAMAAILGVILRLPPPQAGDGKPPDEIALSGSPDRAPSGPDIAVDNAPLLI
jgi:ferredoxin